MKTASILMVTVVALCTSLFETSAAYSQTTERLEDLNTMPRYVQEAFAFLRKNDHESNECRSFELHTWPRNVQNTPHGAMYDRAFRLYATYDGVQKDVPNIPNPLRFAAARAHRQAVEEGLCSRYRLVRMYVSGSSFTLSCDETPPEVIQSFNTWEPRDDEDEAAETPMWTDRLPTQ